MDITNILFLLLLTAFGWFWFDSLRALEVARNAGRLACNNANVQFLDDTVAGITLALARNMSGQMLLRRTYHFEFSDTGDTRLEGQVIVLGDKVESVSMEPFRMRS